jgi:hypothetical protein
MVARNIREAALTRRYKKSAASYQAIAAAVLLQDMEETLEHMGELLAPVRAIPLLAGETNCARSAPTILRRRAADDRFKVINQV